MKTDKQLKEDVEEELRWEPSVHEEQIGVSARNGVIELDGEVGSYAEKLTAEKAALRVADVKALASQIRVVIDTASSHTDEDIARAAMHALEWNYLVPKETKVKVSDGWITLEGKADWQYRRDEAERVVRQLNGVKGVINLMKLEPTATAADVKSKIEKAFKRSAAIDAAAIRVEAANGTVTLKGHVKSWAEREEAEREAWAAPGITVVEDLITVG